MVHIYGHHTQKVSSEPGSIDNFTLYDYLRLAEYHLKKNDNEDKNNDDAISFVAEEMMIAAQKYDPNIGCKFSTYIHYCGKFGVKKWIDSKNKSGHNPKTEHKKKECGYVVDYIGDIIRKDENSKVDQIILETPLTNQQFHCVSNTLSGMSPSEISRHIGISRKAVYCHISKAKVKLHNTAMGDKHD